MRIHADYLPILYIFIAGVVAGLALAEILVYSVR